MASSTETGPLGEVANERVWRLTRFPFLGFGILFLVNTLVGFDNAVTTGALPRPVRRRP